MKHPLYFHWGVSMLFGWGVYGLNLLRHWEKIAGTPALCIGQIHLESLAGMDPLSLRALTNPLVQSDQTRIDILTQAVKMPLPGMVVHSLGNRFSGSPLPRDGGSTGLSTCAAIFFEDTHLPDAKNICGDYGVIVAGSTWCEEVLRANGVENVTTVIQGVDISSFHPAPRAGALEGRFAVFSGGKLEHRKAQDLVIQSFKIFAQRHPEAVLVTAWHSPWPQTAVTVNGNRHIAPIGFTAEGQADIHGWVAANGIPADQFVDLGSIPNHLMARVVREMDVALFPNRCEGGTNLVAMECMACGVPTIVSNNTGHKDLVATGGTYALDRQAIVPAEGWGNDGWGESDVDEIVESLEKVWANREDAKRRGQKAAEAMAKLSWRNQIASLHQALEPFAP